MVMRRFPWKAPRMSEPSFKNFASALNPYVTSTESKIPSSAGISRKSTLDSSSTLTPSSSLPRNHVSTTISGSSPKKAEYPPAPPPLNKGPMKLLNRLSPGACRPLIGRMLDINPKTRANMEEVWTDPWFVGLKRCEMAEEQSPNGRKRIVVKRDGRHEHVLVGPNGDDVTPSGNTIKRVSKSGF